MKHIFVTSHKYISRYKLNPSIPVINAVNLENMILVCKIYMILSFTLRKITIIKGIVKSIGERKYILRKLINLLRKEREKERKREI